MLHIKNDFLQYASSAEYTALRFGLRSQHNNTVFAQEIYVWAVRFLCCFTFLIRFYFECVVRLWTRKPIPMHQTLLLTLGSLYIYTYSRATSKNLRIHNPQRFIIVYYNVSSMCMFTLWCHMYCTMSFWHFVAWKISHHHCR